MFGQLLVSVLFCFSLVVADDNAEAEHAPLYKYKNSIKNQYIIVLKESGTDRSNLDSFFRDFDGNQSIIAVYDTNMEGYAAKLDEHTINFMRKDPRIAYIEEDQVFSINNCEASDYAKSWHLPRITSRRLNENGNRYYYSTASGRGVTAYIIDTGVNAAHVDFEGRATAAASFVWGEPNEDTNGHGTCVAGVVAGKDYGVSKQTRILALKVFGRQGQGSTSNILSALNWAIRHHRQNPGQKSIINMSLGGGYSYSLNQLSDQAVNEGIPVIVAAGNEGQDACNVSPASASMVLSVGATNSRDVLASFSNHGRCVNLLAPGESVNCPWIGSRTAIKTGISGTSFASPCVAGYGAHLLSIGNYNARSLYQKIIEDSQKNVVYVNRPATVNRLLYNKCS